MDSHLPASQDAEENKEIYTVWQTIGRRSVRREGEREKRN